MKRPVHSGNVGQLTTLTLLGLGLAAILYALFQFNLGWLNRTAAGGEFQVHWVGSRALLLEHTDPYGATVPRLVQSFVYGRAAREAEQPYILTWPLDLLLLTFPFALIQQPHIALAAFTVVSELALIVFAAMALVLAGWRPKPHLLVLYAAFCGLNYYSFKTLSEGSATLLIALAFAFILLCLERGNYEIAGALMVLTTFHWEIGGPFLLVVAARAARQQPRLTLLGAGMLGAILLVSSFLLYPGWILPFLRAVSNDLRVPYGTTVGELLRAFLPGAGAALTMPFQAALIGLLILESRAAVAADSRRFFWAACLVLAATPLLGQRSEIENLSILFLPWAMLLRSVHERWRRLGDGPAVGLMLALLIGPWLLAAAGGEVPLPRSQALVFAFLPVLTIVGLYWMRWWAVRPPRLWADAQDFVQPHAGPP